MVCWLKSQKGVKTISGFHLIAIPIFHCQQLREIKIVFKNRYNLSAIIYLKINATDFVCGTLFATDFVCYWFGVWMVEPSWFLGRNHRSPRRPPGNEIQKHRIQTWRLFPGIRVVYGQIIVIFRSYLSEFKPLIYCFKARIGCLFYSAKNVWD